MHDQLDFLMVVLTFKLSLKFFHNYIQGRIAFEKFVESHNVGMVHGLENLNLMASLFKVHLLLVYALCGEKLPINFTFQLQHLTSCSPYPRKSAHSNFGSHRVTLVEALERNFSCKVVSKGQQMVMLSLHKLARYTKSIEHAIFDSEKHWRTRAQLDSDVDHQSSNN